MPEKPSRARETTAIVIAALIIAAITAAFLLYDGGFSTAPDTVNENQGVAPHQSEQE